MAALDSMGFSDTYDLVYNSSAMLCMALLSLGREWEAIAYLERAVQGRLAAMASGSLRPGPTGDLVLAELHAKLGIVLRTVGREGDARGKFARGSQAFARIRGPTSELAMSLAEAVRGML